MPAMTVAIRAPPPAYRALFSDPAEVDAVAVGDQFADVLEQVEVGEPERVGPGELGPVLRRGHEQPPDRHEEVEREDAHDDHGARPGERALARAARDRAHPLGEALTAAHGGWSVDGAHLASFRWVNLRNAKERMNVASASTTENAAARLKFGMDEVE